MRNEQIDNYSYTSNTNGGSAVKTGLAYFLIGGGIGAVVALLFAPKSGTELRGELADVTKRGLDATREKATELRAQSSEAIGTLREKAEEIYQNASTRLGKSEEALDVATFETAMAEENVRPISDHSGEPTTAPRTAGRKPSSIM